MSQIGAGIQVLPNSLKVLKHWGLEPTLSPHASSPKCANLISWKGSPLSSLDFSKSAANYPGTSYWDFHRADLHRVLIERAIGLGATMECNARAVEVRFGDDTTVILADGSELSADLVIGADGIHSRMREVLVGRKQPPKRTGDLAYRLLLDTKKLLKDPELAPLVEAKEVNYWIGPGAHVGKFKVEHNVLGH